MNKQKIAVGLAAEPLSEQLLAKRTISEPAIVPPGTGDRLLPPSWRKPALVGVKVVHSLIYFSIEFCMGYLIYAGLKGREDRRTAIAAAVVAGESIIFLGNRCRCPLTGVAEDLGAARGSVTDIYLPPLACLQYLPPPRAAPRFGVVPACQELPPVVKSKGWRT
jgi:hypothetical protein